MTTFLSNLQDSILILFKLLKLSLTDSNFYKDVLTKFSGYGLKFVFVLIYIGTIGASIILTFRLEPIKEYARTKTVTSNATIIIDSIIKNWETFYFDGRFIKSHSSEPIIIKTPANKPIIAIDDNDTLTGSARKNIPIIFTKSKLLLGSGESSSGGHQVSLDYQNIFGDQKLTLDSEYVLSAIKEYIDYFDKIIIFVFTPIMVLLNLVTLLLEKILMTIIVFFTLKLFLGIETTIKSSIRVVLFSCGVSALLMPFSIIWGTIGLISNLLQFWTSILIILAITNMQGKNIRK